VTKDEIRRETILKRDSLSLEEVQKMSDTISRAFIASPLFRDAQTIFLYSPIKNEVRTDKIFRAAREAGKRVGYPLINHRAREIEYIEVVDTEELTSGYYGILEPPKCDGRAIRPNGGDIVIVPGVAFDARGHRVGYGGGFYDRFLSEIGSEVTTVGLAFALQIIPIISEEPHDIRLGYIVTEDRMIHCR